MDNEKLRKLSPKIKIHSDNERIDIFIDEFIEYLDEDLISEIKVELPQDTCHTRGRVVTWGMKAGKTDSKQLF